MEANLTQVWSCLAYYVYLLYVIEMPERCAFSESDTMDPDIEGESVGCRQIRRRDDSHA